MKQPQQPSRHRPVRDLSYDLFVALLIDRASPMIAPRQHARRMIQLGLRVRACLANLLFGACIAAAWFRSGHELASVQASDEAIKPAAEAATKTANDEWHVHVTPFFKSYCADCHAEPPQEAGLDLRPMENPASVVDRHTAWRSIEQRVVQREMPPDTAKQPTDLERQSFLQTLRTQREMHLASRAGDPGPFRPRRLSHAEYDYTIRDLTGVDFQWFAKFPVDAANEAGFDNSADTLTMSAPLMQKYLDAAQQVADQIVFAADHFRFATHAMVADSDRDKYCVESIIRFYNRHQVDLSRYLKALYDHQHHESVDSSTQTIAQLAAERSLSERYLQRLYTALTTEPTGRGPLTDLYRAFHALPAPPIEDHVLREQCEAIRDATIDARQKLIKEASAPQARGVSNGSQAFILWKNRLEATQRMTFHGATPENIDRENCQAFCELIPDAFFVTERGLTSNRPLSAGFHLMMGYFRDDAPLCTLVLNDSEQAELDRLWQELDLITDAPRRQYKDYLFFERAEPPRFMREARFDFARPEDQDCASDEKIERLRKEYLAKARESDASDEAVRAIDDHFQRIGDAIRRVQTLRVQSETHHLDQLVTFARRAFRRPLTPHEQQELLDFYRSRRTALALSHEDAFRDTIVSLLASPYFLYRSESLPAGRSIQPVSDLNLASRLSYFLWSSMPDDELLSLAEAGQLHQRDTLLAQTRRMMLDPRTRAVAVEFGLNWLDGRRFHEHQGVDRQRFPSFTDDLRASMQEEPIRFLLDALRHDRSLLELLNGQHTFVNRELASHYGIPFPDNTVDEWVRVDNAGFYGRGGLLPMGIFLTHNSPGLRTSPVKRGYWVVKRLLGETIPAPPPSVPELPKDEAATGDLSVRDLLARHRQDQQCATCHERFDAVGLAFEGYGPVGERRERDLGGRAVDAEADFPGGMRGDGLAGLQNYLRTQRQEQFVDNVVRKLLAYALGRNLWFTDEPTVESLKNQLAANDYRTRVLIEGIVTSPQFLNQRPRDWSD